MRTASTSGRRVDYLVLALILLLALVARFRYLTYIEHNIDHAYPVWQAMTTLDRGALPVAGQQTSVQFANPALTGYLFLPVVALTRSPLAVYVLVIALNTLGVLLAYRAARALIPARLALIAAGLMAVNPWVIEYSRTSWVQSLLPFLMGAVAWLLWPVLMGRARRPGRRLLLALAMATVLTQTYLLAFFVAVPVSLLLLIFRRRLPRRSLLAGAALFGLAAAIFGAALLADIDSARERARAFTDDGARVSLEAWNHAVRLVSGDDYAIARGVDAPAGDSARRHQLEQLPHGLLLAALLLGIGAALVALRRPGSRRDAAIIALVWFGLPILAMSYTENPVHPTYQLLTLPAGYVLAAWGIGVALRPHRSRLGAVVVLLLALPFAALMLTNSARYYQETAARPGAHGLGALPVGDGLELGDRLLRHLPPGGVVYADMPEWIANSFAGRLFPVLTDTRAPAFYTIPARGGLYITVNGADEPQAEVARRVEERRLADGTRISIDALPPAAEADLPGLVLDVPSQQGLRLLRYDLVGAGTDWALTTVWRVDGIADEVWQRIYTPFIHVHDASGERVRIVHGEGLPGYFWGVGDIHVFRMAFDVPADGGPFELRLGQYDGLHNANLIFTPPDAPPDAVVVLPERVGE